MMERQVHHLVRLVDDLLELSRVSRGKIELARERLELATVIHNAVETTRPWIEARKHKLIVAVPPQAIFVDGDPVRLTQIFANLLNNAAKYTEDRGKITISARVEGEEVVVSVRDTGIGIPRNMLTQIFEMFAQVDTTLRRSQEGLGIGLNLVRTLVTMHGGTVQALSEGVGLGSEFLVRLPIARDGDAPAAPQPAALPAPSLLAGPRVLVVDDNRDAADSLGILLKYLGADVHTVYDGPSTLDALRFFKPSVILLDLGMPGMDGLEVARRIRQTPEFKDVMLIALTGWGQERDREQSREAGFNHHLVKPVDLDALQSLLASLAPRKPPRG
jgi:CheY-like chemotaxis protein